MLGMCRFAVAALVLAVATPVTAQKLTIHGIGASSCATWLSSPGTEAAGNSWSLGFWTAMNFYVERDAPMVGTTTDTNGILASIRRECEMDPAETLAFAVVQVFFAFKGNAR